jgi:hypothetical protein
LAGDGDAFREQTWTDYSDRIASDLGRLDGILNLGSFLGPFEDADSR